MKLNVGREDDTVWLSQCHSTELFGKAKGTMSQNVSHLADYGEVRVGANVRLFRTVRLERTLNQRSRNLQPPSVRHQKWRRDR